MSILHLVWDSVGVIVLAVGILNLAFILLDVIKENLNKDSK